MVWNCALVEIEAKPLAQSVRDGEVSDVAQIRWLGLV